MRALGLAALIAVLAACPAPKPPDRPADPSLADALAAAGQAVADGGGPEARRELGWLLFFAGERERGRAELADASAQLGRNDVRAQLGLAMIDDLMMDERAVDAWLALATLAAQRPGDPWATAAGVAAARWLDDRATDVGDVKAAAAVEALQRPGPAPAVVAAALDSRRFRQRAETEGLAAWTDRRGCVTAWERRESDERAPHVRLLAVKRLAPLPEAPAGEARLTAAPRCLAVVRPARKRAQYAQLSTFVTSDREREIELELRVEDVDVLGRVWWDQELVIGRDTVRRFLPARQRARVKIGAGTSRVVVELAGLGGAYGVELIARDPATGARPEGLAWAEDPTVRPAGPHAAAAEFRAAPAPAWPDQRSLADRLLVDALVVRAALDAGDAATAAEAVIRLRRTAPAWVPGFELEAEVALALPAQAGPIVRDAARRAWTRALEIDPGAVRPRLTLVGHLLGDDDVTGALKTLGAEAPGAPPGGTLKGWRAELLRVSALRERGLEADADAALARAVAEAPEACDVIHEQVQTAARKGRAAELRAAAERLVACDGWSPILAAVAEDAGDHVLRIAERERLLARSPQDPGRHVDLGRALLAAGKPREAKAAFERALELDPWAVGARLALADVIAAGGEPRTARALLAAGLALDPEARLLAAAIVALGGEDDLAPWRIDGRPVIRAYEAAEKQGSKYSAPAVLVLDRMVVLVRPGGARLNLVHQIIKVLEKDGLERWGELDVPGHAELLVARTIKADGSVREPQQLGAKEGLTAPDLAVGDYVELEYFVTVPETSAWGGGGFVGDRFFFHGFDAPFDRTEYIVVAPRGLDLEWDLRGTPPAPRVEEIDGFTVTTFQARGQAQLVPEPAGPPPVEWMNSVMPYAGVSLDGWRRWVGEQTYGARRADRAVTLLAQDLAAAGGVDRTARAIHDWVLDNVDDGGTLADEPALVLSRRSGRRVPLLLALADAVGIKAELWLARPRDSGRGRIPASEITDLAYPLVRLRLPKGDLWVDPRHRYAPLGYLTPNLRDVPIVLVPDPEAPAPAAELMLTPETSKWPDRRRVSLDVKLAASGAAHLEVVETLEGLPAAQFRDYLKDVPADEVERDLEQRALGFWFPGAALESLTIEGKDDPYVPLVLKYHFTAPRFARPANGGALAVSVAPMPELWARRYVLVGARTTPLVLDGSGGEQEVVMRVALPPGMKPAGGALPADVKLAAPGGVARTTATVRFEGGVLETRTTSSAESFGRVAAADYPAFMRFAADADAAEAAVVVVGK